MFAPALLIQAQNEENHQPAIVSALPGLEAAEKVHHENDDGE